MIMDDKQQILRLRRTGLGLVGALIHSTVCGILFYHGWFRTTLAGFYLLFGFFWVVNLIFPMLIITGINKRFPDPSLTLMQMLWGIACITTTIFFADALRSELMMLNLLLIVFAGVYLTKFELNLVVIYTLILYMIVIRAFMFYPPSNFMLSKELLIFGIHSMILLGFLIVAHEFRGLRNYLHIKVALLRDDLERAEAASVVDDLTGVKNRKYMLSVLETQRLLVERQGSNYVFTVFMMDIDYFKDVNDRYGHALGDTILKAVCKEIESGLRKTDYFGRIGGEEFLIIAPFTNEKQGKTVAERIRRTVERASFDDIIPGLRLTISIGMTVYEWPETISETLNRVDEALYLAKNQGRNRAVAN